jgi:hypothetical protein
MLLYFSDQLARTSRAWSACLSRFALAVYRPRSRFHHQQMGVVFQLPVIDLQSLDGLQKSLQQSCIINQKCILWLVRDKENSLD